MKFYDDTGVLLLEHPWPEPGTKHVSNGRPRGAGTARPKDIRDVIHSTGTTTPPGEYNSTIRADGRVSIRNVVYGIGICQGEWGQREFRRLVVVWDCPEFS